MIGIYWLSPRDRFYRHTDCLIYEPVSILLIFHGLPMLQMRRVHRRSFDFELESSGLSILALYFSRISAGN